MAKGRPFKLPGFRAYLGEIKQVTAREAAKEIVTDLIKVGPWYSGQFAKNWVVEPGDVRIPATVEQGDVRAKTGREAVPLPSIRSLRGTGATGGYTIDNRTTYRRVAMDLVPGRVENALVLSAEPDWYRTYVEAGPMAQALKRATGKAIENPRIKGFKSRREFGPFGRVER